MVLHGSKRVVENARHHGGLHEAEAERLLDLIDRQACRLNTEPWQKALPEQEEVALPGVGTVSTTSDPGPQIIAAPDELAGSGNSYWPADPQNRVTTIRVRTSEMGASMKKSGPASGRRETVTLRHALSAGWLMGLHRGERKKRRRATRWTAMQHANKVHPTSKAA